MLDYIVMQMRKTNREKGYWIFLSIIFKLNLILFTMSSRNCDVNCIANAKKINNRFNDEQNKRIGKLFESYVKFIICSV